jgi:hypothetical protein
MSVPERPGLRDRPVLSSPVPGTVPSALFGTLDAMALIRGEPTVSELAGPAEFRDVDSETGIEAVLRGFGVHLEAAGALSQKRAFLRRRPRGRVDCDNSIIALLVWAILAMVARGPFRE